MNVEFCTKCGYKNTYSIQAPNFCGGCGAPMRETPGLKKSNVASRNEEAIENDEDHVEVSNISKLEYSVQDFSGNRKLTIGQLIKEGPSEGVKPQRGSRGSKFSTKEEILKEGLNSCKSAKTKPSEDVGE